MSTINGNENYLLRAIPIVFVKTKALEKLLGWI